MKVPNFLSVFWPFSHRQRVLSQTCFRQLAVGDSPTDCRPFSNSGGFSQLCTGSKFDDAPTHCKTFSVELRPVAHKYQKPPVPPYAVNPFLFNRRIQQAADQEAAGFTTKRTKHTKCPIEWSTNSMPGPRGRNRTTCAPHCSFLHSFVSFVSFVVHPNGQSSW